jgi:hypothetical protein
MKTNEQIQFLKAFIVVWDFAQNTNAQSAQPSDTNALTNILNSFCEDNGLPKLSADELLYKLQHPTEYSNYFKK